MPSTSVTICVKEVENNRWVLSLVLYDRRQLDDVTADDVTVPSFCCGDGERSVAVSVVRPVLRSVMNRKTQRQNVDMAKVFNK